MKERENRREKRKMNKMKGEEGRKIAKSGNP
jgi:hypothetical protein